jgi:hypothetical protein
LIVATNIGTEATNAQFEVTDNLPVGLKPSSVAAPSGLYGGDLSVVQMSCGVVGQAITCQGGTPALRAGESAHMVIPVEVELGAPSPVEDNATIEGGGATTIGTSTSTPIDSTPSLFGFPPGPGGLSFVATQAEGEPSVVAGGHPYQLSVGLGFTSNFPAINPSEPAERKLVATGGGVRDISTVLPQGLVVDPLAATQCTDAQFEGGGSNGADCPPSSQVGIVSLPFSLAGFPSVFNRPIYNMKAPPGAAGALGFEVLEGVNVQLLGSVRSDGSYELSAVANDITAKAPIFGATVTLWGNPSDESHDGVRGNCLKVAGACSIQPETRSGEAFLTLPSACSGPLQVSATVDSWEAPGTEVSRVAESTDRDGNAVGVEGCAELAFEPSFNLHPETGTSESPSGLAVNIHVPQNENYEEAGTGARASANLKDVKVTLPVGMSVNPAAAGGREACSIAQVGLQSGVGGTPIRFNEAPASCPASAKVGTVSIGTPLLDHPLPGSIYLADPYQNPFDSLLGVYLVIEDPVTGIVAKIAGRVEAEDSTGQLTATFVENPELPIEDVDVNFFGGSRAALMTPQTCGGFAAAAELAPWSGTAPVGLSGEFDITSVPSGGPCAATVAQLPNNPSFQAGTSSSLAGAYSPFVLHLNREDGSQRFAALNVTLPPGLTGRVAGVSYCPDSALASAAGKAGMEELASPSCPAASEVGKVTVAAGAGPNPYYVSGHAYLTGPYKGAPLGLAIVTPAVAGPYDLGTVVVRSALQVNPETAQISVESDPLPTTLKGIPLDIRSISVEILRSQFTLNPTSCEPTAVTAQVVGASGNVSQASSPFQVGQCKGLGFKPKLHLKLSGNTKRTGHPALRAELTARPGDANIAKAAVTLPPTEFIDQARVNSPCTRPQFSSGTCPANSVLGYARAFSPLLAAPLEGPVYFRSNGGARKLPDLVADLNGQVHLTLVGFVDGVATKGTEVSRIRTTFATVPDAPVSKFVLNLKGGKKGLLENSANLCKSRKVAVVRLTAQNRKVETFEQLVANSCRKKAAGANKAPTH